MKKNILLIGNEGISNLENSYYKALKKIGYNVDFYRIDRNIKNRFLAKLESLFPFVKNKFLRLKLLSFLRRNKKNYYFIFLFKGTYLNLKTLKKIKSIKKTIWINFFPDDPLNINDNSISNANFIKTIPNFDIFFIWSNKIKKNLESKFKRSYFVYLPFAFDNIRNYKVIKKNKFNKTLRFVGTHDINREEILSKIKYKTEVYGGNWKRLIHPQKQNFKIHGHIHGKKLTNLISSSVINLNILRKQNYTSHNMKTFEIPGNFGLMLTNRSKEQNYFFKENQSCFMYSNIQELNKKINFIEKNPKLSLKVRKRGYKVVKKHNYLNRSKFLIKTIDEFKRKKI